MPAGKPDLIGVVKYPTIAQHLETVPRKNIRAVLFFLVNDFCKSVNVVRNMTEDQMIDTASFLLDECGNYRIEDYVMMFTMAKRGQLVKILDRVDIQIVGQLRDAYDCMRYNAGERHREEQLKMIGREVPILHEDEDEKSRRFDEAMNNFKKMVEEEKHEQEIKRKEKLKTIHDNNKKRIEEIMEWRKANGVPLDAPLINIETFLSKKK